MAAHVPDHPPHTVTEWSAWGRAADGWPACNVTGPTGRCVVPPPRFEDASVPVDPVKFPPSTPGANDGLKVVADKLHAKGFKLGIYTVGGPPPPPLHHLCWPRTSPDRAAAARERTERSRPLRVSWLRTVGPDGSRFGLVRVHAAAS